MKRRRNIGLGLLNRPTLLVLDEPTVGVDPQSRNATPEGSAHWVTACDCDVFAAQKTQSRVQTGTEPAPAEGARTTDGPRLTGFPLKDSSAKGCGSPAMV